MYIKKEKALNKKMKNEIFFLFIIDLKVTV